MSLDPSTIGRYKVLGTLGAGSMGTVYLAEDPLLKRPLAIKVVREGTGDDEVLARFKREAEISARLNHPNAITVFDVGEEPGVGPFLAMEFVEGESLSDRLRRGPLPAGLAVMLLLQAAEALEAVHALDVVHRDIKPENFMVAEDGRLKLMDFGVARGDQERLTSTSTFLGTPAYAAPELLNGAKATKASDRWAFTLTAFEMLTGRLPFQGDSVGAVLYRIVHEEPTFPEGFAPQVAELFRKAMDKDPAARFPDLTAFLRALVRALDLDEADRSSALARLDAPAVARTTRRMVLGNGLAPWHRRWRWAIATGVLALVAVGLLLLRQPASRVLSIESRPSGAEVILDGTPLGRTPLRQIVVKGRAERLRLEKADHLPLEVVLKPEDRDLSLRLKPAPFQVQVTTEPPGAEVYLDGQPVGLSPLALEVPGEGAHQLKVSLEGHQVWTAPLERHKPLPNPIRLGKAPRKKAESEGKLKKFFRGIFQK